MASLCITLTESTTVDIIDRMADLADLADVFEIRGDLATEIDLLTILRARTRPLIFTARSASEGGKMWDDDPRRRTLLYEAVRRGYDYVDVEYRSGFFDVMTEKAGKGLIVSFHDLAGCPQDLETLYDGMCKTGADIVKIAVTPKSLTDVGRLMELARQKASAQTPLVAIAMGPLGAITRIVAPRYGAPFVYASSARGREAAAGQIPAEEMDAVYRVKSITSQTRVYGLVGTDVSWSLSPAIHNRGFREIGLDAVFTPLQADSLEAFFEAFPHLELSGFSVTRPYKVGMAARMQTVDATVAQCGSVNTVVVQNDGQLAGSSTDGLGVVTPLRKRGDIAGRNIVILGAGGAARAAAVSLRERGGAVRILSRDRARASEVSAVVGCAAGDFNDLPNAAWDILINATPVGGGSLLDQSLVPKDQLRKGALVLDMVYDPLETRLLREAAEAGCIGISGFEMLLAQATAQFELWTGSAAPVDAMQSAALLLAQSRSA